jgi:hypothetical protein
MGRNSLRGVIGLRVWVLLGGKLRKGDYGDVEALPEGLKVKPPAGMAKKLLIGGICGTFLARGKPFTIPYDKIRNVKIVDVKPGLVGGKKQFIELNFVDEEGRSQTLTFAACGITGFEDEKTRKLYEEITSKLKVS